jgi:hypothetical protein
MKKLFVALALRLPGLDRRSWQSLRRTQDQRRPHVVLELYPEKAPKTVANFLEYVKSRPSTMA